MAAYSSGSNNRELISRLHENGVLRSSKVIEVMLRVDRQNYSPKDPYADSPQDIGFGAVISAPHTHGYALELLEPFLVRGARVLDVGSGSGYLTACMGLMVGPEGIVVGIEHVPELVHQAEDNVTCDCEFLLSSRVVKFVVGDGRYGYSESAPYDAIYVGRASPEVPLLLAHQLKIKGRMLVAIGPRRDIQVLEVIDKIGHGILRRDCVMGVQYAHLTERHTQLSEYKYKMNERN